MTNRLLILSVNMADESVVFEVQVEKKVLEQIFHENKHLKQSYQHLVDNQDEVKALNQQLVALKIELKDQQQTNDHLTEIITRLNTEIEHLKEANSNAVELENTESKLLTLKLQNVEAEKERIVAEYEEQAKILQERLSDHSKLSLLEENLKDLTDELDRATTRLTKFEIENKRLDADNLKLEMAVNEVTARLRLEEERNKSVDLEHVESKLLKLKLQTIENEKNYLIKDFERERKIIVKQNQPRMAKFEENIKLLRTWIEKERRERRPHQMSEEVRMLKDKIQTLENEKRDLTEGFEMERRVFRKIFKSNSENEQESG